MTVQKFRLTHQDRIKLTTMALDFVAWEEPPLSQLWQNPPEKLTGKNRKQWSLKKLEELWMGLKTAPTEYSAQADNNQTTEVSIDQASQDSLIFKKLPESDESTLMGTCPVSSEKTRCCQLKTLDAVIHCGFDCSYCTIQSFYKDNTIRFHGGLGEKLKRLNLNPNETYHIGTGQSSDSLLWGNRDNLLTDLFEFAQSNPNVILELKTKAGKITHLENNTIPPNVLTTWSLNTPVIIREEERGTASLSARLDAAEKVAAKGNLVGFHFHPMIPYKGWEEEYTVVFDEILRRFDPNQVTHISFGTLTFIKPVIKAIRERGMKTKILQMPLEEAAGKFSYSLETKEKLFRTAYEAFTPWHNNVFFYLCMEDASLWEPVFGMDYESNDAFESAMTNSYMNKIQEKRNALPKAAGQKV